MQCNAPPSINKYHLNSALFSQATRSGGVLTLVGLGPPEVKIPIVDASVREVDIRGMFRYRAGW